MTRMVTAQCPNCGASLRVDPDFEATTCKYCNATAFVKTRVRPVTERVTKQYPLVINATTGVLAPHPISTTRAYGFDRSVRVTVEHGAFRVFSLVAQVRTQCGQRLLGSPVPGGGAATSGS